jgi:hypothetical protein
MRAVPHFEDAVRHEVVPDVETAASVVVLILHQQVHVADSPPRPFLEMPEQILEDHRRFENEPCAGLKHGGYRAQEGGVAFVVQVAEAVPDTEGAVKAAGPR